MQKMTRQEYMRRLSARARIIKTVNCVHCGAITGQVCRGENHDRRTVHDDRLKAYHNQKLQS